MAPALGRVVVDTAVVGSPFEPVVTTVPVTVVEPLPLELPLLVVLPLLLAPLLLLPLPVPLPLPLLPPLRVVEVVAAPAPDEVDEGAAVMLIVALLPLAPAEVEAGTPDRSPALKLEHTALPALWAWLTSDRLQLPSRQPAAATPIEAWVGPHWHPISLAGQPTLLMAEARQDVCWLPRGKRSAS